MCFWLCCMYQVSDCFNDGYSEFYIFVPQHYSHSYNNNNNNFIDNNIDSNNSFNKNSVAHKRMIIIIILIGK